MSRSIIICLGSLLVAATLSSQAAVYKCTDAKGNVTFSGMPCAKDAKPIEVNVSAPSKEGFNQSEARLQAMEADQAEGRKQRQIQSLQEEIKKKQRKRDKELAILRNKKSYARNNLAGATWEESISTEMQAVTDRYQGEIDSLNQEISSLRAAK